MSYAFRKLYVDLVSDDGTVCVLTLASVRLLGWHGRATLEVYRPDGSTAREHGDLDVQALEPETLELPLRIRLKTGALEIRAEIAHRAWVPRAPPPRSGLSWKVLAARIDGSVRLNGSQPIAGRGYADWVELTRATRRMGFEKLGWGRIHFPRTSLVFEDIDFRDGAHWRLAARWNGNSKLEELTPSFSVDPSGNGVLELSERDRIEIRPKRLLVAGDAFAPERVPAWSDRLLANLIGGRTDQMRFLGEARMNGETGVALYESVRFGH